MRASVYDAGVLRRIARYCFAVYLLLFTVSAAVWGWSWIRKEGFWALGGPPNEDATWFAMSNVGRLEITRYGSGRTAKLEWFDDYVRQNLIESGTRAGWLPEFEVHRYQVPARFLPAGSAPIEVVRGWMLVIPLYLQPLVFGGLSAGMWGWRWRGRRAGRRGCGFDVRPIP